MMDLIGLKVLQSLIFSLIITYLLLSCRRGQKISFSGKLRIFLWCTLAPIPQFIDLFANPAIRVLSFLIAFVGISYYILKDNLIYSITNCLFSFFVLCWEIWERALY